MNITNQKIFTAVMQKLEEDRPELKLFPYQDQGVIFVHVENKLVASIKFEDEDI